MPCSPLAELQPSTFTTNATVAPSVDDRATTLRKALLVRHKIALLANGEEQAADELVIAANQVGQLTKLDWVSACLTN
jgi:hypothetical protein